MSTPAGLDSAALARWAGAARDALEAARAEIDDLNVCTSCLKAGKVVR